MTVLAHTSHAVSYVGVGDVPQGCSKWSTLLSDIDVTALRDAGSSCRSKET